MTAYTTISNALVAVGAKPFATTIQALRDNPIAIAEGDATAHAAGVAIRLSALQQLIAGSTIRLRLDATSNNATTSFTDRLIFGISQSGQVRLTLEHRTGVGASEARVLRTRAGTTSIVGGTWSAGSTFTARSVDIDVLPGDQIAVQHRHTTGGTAEIRNVRVSTDAATRLIPLDNFGVWENMA